MRSPRRICRGAAMAVAAATLVAGCTWVPPAPLQDHALAKEFITHPDAATIYIYRSQFNHYDTDTILYLDGRVIGSTTAGTYFRLDINPGRHILHGTGVDTGEISVETRPGQIYFVALDVFGAQSKFRLVPDTVGRSRVVSCCTLLDSSMPGLRPLALR